MTIPILNATSLQRVLQSGRTQPCLFFCEDESGQSDGEYVVKLKAGMENGVNGLAAELIASQLANFLDIPTPEPAIIELDPLLAEVIPDPELSRKIKESAGLNFGSRVITGGFETWPVGKAIPSSLKTLAAEIFAFDALIQNPDRKVNKPNILWKGDNLYIIDHEMSLMFIYEILPMQNPWQITNLRFIKEHLFYGNLKGQTVNLDRFAGALDLLTDNVIETILVNVPEAWQSNNISKIKTHINEIVHHSNDFVDEIRRALQ
ncbi:MAG: hypothetical protein M1610_05710 [Nitrospirae bacterium]|nr:hypothetical protein [Nitrospirota bacterium]MDA8338991.1 hypothetical protein [Nitrospiraceae bacterium]